MYCILQFSWQVVLVPVIISIISQVIITVHAAKSGSEETDGEDWDEYKGICFDDNSPPYDRITVKRTLARCKLACVQEREFLCLSIEWDMRDHFCNLTRHSVDIKKPLRPCNPNWVMLYERVDPPAAFVPSKPGSYDDDMYQKWIAPKNKPVPKDMVETWEMDVDELKEKLTKMKKEKEKKERKKKKDGKKDGTAKKETDKSSEKEEESEPTSVEYNPDEVLEKLMPHGSINTGFMKNKYKIKKHMMPKEEL